MSTKTKVERKVVETTQGRTLTMERDKNTNRFKIVSNVKTIKAKKK